MRITATLVLLLALAPLALHAADEPSSGFGDSVQGVSLALLPRSAEGQPVLVLRNANPTVLDLHGAFAWLLMAQSREVAFYSEKIALDAAQQQLEPAGELRVPVPLKQLRVRPYQKGTKVVDGYPQNDAAGSSSSLDLLSSGIKTQAVVYVPAGGQRISVKSKAVTLSLMRLASTQSDDMVALLERFRRDAFAARDAHEQAAAAGPRAVPALVQGLRDPTMPDYGKMWMAAALTRIGGDEAAAAVVSLVDDPNEGVRNVAAFWGTTMRVGRVDDAILRRAKSGQDPLFTAWAARGYAEHSRAVPPGLMLAALDSAEPRARAEVAEVLASSGEAADKQRLVKLFGDANELVRVAAADAVGRHPGQPQPVIVAMVAALDRDGESARTRIVAALARSAGRDWRYVPDGTPEQNRRVLQEIRSWGSERK